MNKAVVESWHRDSRDVSVRRAAPAGFRFIDVLRDQDRGGGVVIYFRDFFIAKPLDINFKARTFEYVCVSITTPCGPVTVVAIYRPGSSVPDAAFFSEFTTILETLATFNSQLVILGDLNVHLEDLEGGDCITLNGILESFALVQHVDSPTHSTGGLLDVVLRRSDCNIGNLCVDPGAYNRNAPVLLSCLLKNFAVYWRKLKWRI